MAPFHNNMVHLDLKGLIYREKLSSHEQKKHYETNKYLLEIDQAEKDFRLWISEYHKITHGHSRGLISLANAPAKLSYESPRESPTFNEEGRRSSKSSVSVNSNGSFQSRRRRGVRLFDFGGVW